MTSVRTNAAPVTRFLAGPALLVGVAEVVALAMLASLAALAAIGCTQKDERSGAAGSTVSPGSAAAASGPLAVGAPTDGLAAFVKSADLGDASVQAAIPARLRELAPAGKEPRAASAMLRALTAKNGADAATLACSLLDRLPAGYAAQAAEPFIDAALLAIATGGSAANGADCVASVKKRFGEDRCLPSLRCTDDGGRIQIGAATNQRERLCSADDLKKEVAADLVRPKDAVLEDKPKYAVERLALAALYTLNAVPREVVTAHARRQYAVKQPSSPECGIGVALRTPCHCDEAAIRDQVCRNDTTEVLFSFCHATVSDERKEISDVFMSAAP